MKLFLKQNECEMLRCPCWLCGTKL